MNLFKKINQQKLLDFISLRQKDDGGFSAFPSLPHTLQDTFQAIDTLSTMEKQLGGGDLVDSVKTKETIRYVTGSQTGGATGSMRLQYFIAEICRLLKIESRLIPDAIIYDSGGETDYEYGFHRQYFGFSPGDNVLNVDGLFRQKHLTCKDLMFFLKITPDKDCGTLKDKAVDWLRKCQNADGGFGFFPGTTSYIENCHYCLESLSTLGQLPVYGKKTENFILWSQTTSGGFSRNIRAAPFLDSTWHAVRALEALQSLQNIIQAT